MWYPVLNAKQKQQTMIDTFGGYNHTARPAEAEFYDMQNMSGDDFPLLSTRGKRGILPVTDEYVGHMAKDGRLLCLRESGEETLRLTVKDAVEAAELEPRPEGTSIPEPNLQTTVLCSADISDYSGEWYTFHEGRDRNKGEGPYFSWCLVGSADEDETGEWSINFQRKDAKLYGSSIIEFPNSFYKNQVFDNLEDESVSNGWLFASVTLDANSAAWLLSKPIHGQLKIGIQAKYIFTHSNATKVTVDGYYFAACEVLSSTAGANTTIQIKISIADIYNRLIGEHPNAATITGVERIPYLDGYNILSHYSSQIIYPVAYAENEYTWDEAAYRSQIAEADAADKAALEEWEANRVSAIMLNETLTEDVAAAIQKKNIQIGDTPVYVERAVCGKKGEALLYIEKPHDAITAGSEIDTGFRYLSLCSVDPATGVETSAPIGVNACEGTRTMLSMGARVVVFPDKLWVNTIERDEAGRYTDYGTLELTSTLRGQAASSGNEVRSQGVLIALCDSQYNYIGTPTIGKTAPSSPSTGAYWLDNSKTDMQLKVYSQATKMWTAVETYLKIYSVDLSAGFEAGDAVRIMDGAKAWTHPSVDFQDDKDSHIVFAAGEETPHADLTGIYGKMERGYIVVRGILKNGGALEPAQEDKVVMTVRRTVPELDYVVESNNRLWGCHYGKNADGETVNEIYACKQGDPKNWFSYEGTAMDSYAASLGTDGPFTGAAVFAGNPIFFKENYMHRVYGSYPANYQIFTQAVHGVQQGCAHSLAVVNERLFYKAQEGIYVYDGSLPYLMSESLGQQAYTRAIGADGSGKYYVSLEGADGTRDLMVYDLQKRMWYREDKLPVRYMIQLGNTLIAVTRDRRMLDLLGRNGEAEPDFEWYAESGNIGYAIAAKKFVGQMLFRMDLSPGAYVRVQIAYDNDRAYTDLYTSSEAGVGTICVPVRPHRCDHFRVRICGKGAAKLISVTKTIKGGSEK